MIGTKVSSTSSDAVLVYSTYGTDVHVDASCILDRIGGLSLRDNRSARNPIKHVWHESFTGFVPAGQDLPAGVYPGLAADGTGVAWSAGTTTFRMARNPFTGRGTVELAGTQELASFSKRGDWAFLAVIATGLLSKNTSYTTDSSTTRMTRRSNATGAASP